jgi:hypothetical protein
VKSALALGYQIATSREPSCSAPAVSPRERSAARPLIQGFVAPHPHSHAVGIVRLRPPRRRPRQLPLHADRRLGRPHRRRRRPAADRGVALRRHQGPQGRQPRTAAVRLRRPPRPAGRDRLAVEVHRRCQDRRRALRPRAGRHRRRAARQPPGHQRQPAHPGRPGGPPTRTAPPRRCARSAARPSRRRWSSWSGPSNARTPSTSRRWRAPASRPPTSSSGATVGARADCSSVRASGVPEPSGPGCPGAAVG